TACAGGGRQHRRRRGSGLPRQSGRTGQPAGAAEKRDRKRGAGGARSRVGAGPGPDRYRWDRRTGAARRGSGGNGDREPGLSGAVGIAGPLLRPDAAGPVREGRRMSIDAIMEASRSGLNYERLRLEAASRNIAGANTPVAPGSPATRTDVSGFAGQLQGTVKVVEQPVDVRHVHDPGHPLADASGQVAYPAVDMVREM